MKSFEILDCTLRDGSYSIDYQFTANDTAIIAAALESVGIKYIEIGHGLGLNASQAGKGSAAASDVEYLTAVNGVLSKAKFGMFFIPGIGRIENLDLGAKYDMDFVRIGTNVSEIENARDYIHHAKDLGMLVSANLMKSYIYSPEKFAIKAELAEKFGADIIYLVDSSGGMLPRDIKAYISAMRQRGITAKIGFHGHNNLSMAVANTLEAIDNQASFVDSTLKGLGRSAGNAQTEILVVILKKAGYPIDIDEFKLMDIAESLIAPLMKKNTGNDSIAITSGYADFHSSFFGTIDKFSKKYSIDPRKLIVEVCRKTKLDVTDALAEQLAHQLYEDRAALSLIANIDVSRLEHINQKRWNNSLSNGERARLISENLNSLSKKTGKQTVFTINISPNQDDINIVYPSINESTSYYMANCEMTNKGEIIQLCKIIDGVDFILVDDEKKRPHLFSLITDIKKIVLKSVVLTYKDSFTWVQAIDHFIASFVGNVFEKKIAINGINDVSIKLAMMLAERGAKVFVLDTNGDNKRVLAINAVKLRNSPFRVKTIHDKQLLCDQASVVIGFDKNNPVTKEMVDIMNTQGLLIDATFGSLHEDAIDYAKKQGIFVWRTDMKAAMTGEVTTVLRTHAMIANIGKSMICGIPVVAGGYIGNKGDVVLDSISNPTNVIGIADGKGTILYGLESEHLEKIRKIEHEIVINQINPKWTNH